MTDEEFTRRMRRAEADVTPDPRFADRLYVELAGELGHLGGETRAPASAIDRAPTHRRGTQRRLLWLAAAMLLTLLGTITAIVGARLVEPPVESMSTGWPMSRGDAARRGEGLDGPVGQPVLRWRFQAQGAVPDNVSVAGDLAYASSDDGTLHALDVVTGVERWSIVADDPPFSGPAVADGTLYLFDRSGVLHAFDASTGDPRWRSADMVVGASSPTVGDGAVFAGIEDGSLVAIETSDGSVRWRITIASAAMVGSPAFIDGRVYVATDEGGFVAVDAADGHIIWRFDTGDGSTGAAVVADGVAYIGTSGSGGDGTLWAIDAMTGEERWHIEQPLFTPAVSGGVAYSGSLTLGVFAIDAATGRQLWNVPVAGAARPLAVADGVVYVPVTEEHRVYALAAATGDELWHFDVDAQIWCCVAVGEGAVYVGTQLGGVYAIAGSEDPPAPKD